MPGPIKAPAHLTFRINGQDIRAVIYHHAFNGLMNHGMIADGLPPILARPNLSTINGRPC